uniref:Uncharacterized protein n=1 Tax=viral metagenome TaxID=1070528 RepID=A0A6M3IZL3_9ZZZZ
MALNLKDIIWDNQETQASSSGGLNLRDIVWDEHLMEEIERPPEIVPQPEPEEGGFFEDLGPDIVKAGVRGIIGLGEMTARIPRAFGLPGGELRKLTDPVVEGARYLLDQDTGLQYSEKNKQSLIRRAITGGIEAVPQSALGMVAATFGPMAWAGLLTTFGASQYSQHIDQALKEGKTFEESVPYALASGIIEGGGETIADIFGVKFLGIGQANALIRGASKSIKELLTTTFGTYLKGVLKQMPIEIGTEVVQNVGETLMQQLQKLEAPTLEEAAIESIGPAIVMTALFGAGSAGMNTLQNKQLKMALEDPNANPKDRLQAAGFVYEQLSKIDKTRNTTDAELWSKIATASIEQGRPIDLSINISEVKKGLEQQDESENLIGALETDLDNGKISIEAFESMRERMPQYAERIDKKVIAYRGKDPLGANFDTNETITRISQELDDKISGIINLSNLARLGQDIQTGKIRKGVKLPGAMPELAGIKEGEILTKPEVEKVSHRKDLALQEFPELGEIADKIKKNEPVNYWHLDDDQLTKLGYVLGQKVKPQKAPTELQNIAGQLLLGEVPDLSGLTPEDRQTLSTMVEKGQLETAEDVIRLREKTKLPEKEERVTQVVTYYKDIKSVKAVRNANKKFDLIDRRTKENIFPGKEFNTPREAKNYFDEMKREEVKPTEIKEIITPKVTPEVKKEPWEMKKAEIKEKYAFTGLVFDHKGAIKQALSEGKPVPPKVLAEYPELAKEKPKAEWRTKTDKEGKAYHILPGKGQITGEGDQWYALDLKGQIMGEGEIVEPFKTLEEAKAFVEKGEKPAEARGEEIPNLKNISQGKGQVKLYHGTTKDYAEKILKKDKSPWRSANDIAKYIADLYGIDFKEFIESDQVSPLLSIYKTQDISQISTAGSDMARKWAKSGGEIIPILNNEARLFVESKRSGKDVSELMKEGFEIARKKGLKENPDFRADALGLPNKRPEYKGVILELTIDAKDLPQNIKDLADWLSGQGKGGLDQWSKQYIDIKINPEWIKSGKITPLEAYGEEIEGKGVGEVIPKGLPQRVIDIANESGINPNDIEIITESDRKEYVRRYGLPNAIDVGYGVFGKKSGTLFVDEDTGNPVAYLAPRSPAEAKPEKSKAEVKAEGVKDVGKGIETIYRRGNKEGRWWTPNKDYADIFGAFDKDQLLQKKELDLSKLNILDSRNNKKARFLENLNEEEKDKALTERGYDGYLAEGEKGELIYYLKQPIPSEAKPTLVSHIDDAINARERSNRLVEEGQKAVPGIRPQDAEEAGRMSYLLAKGEATQKEFDDWVETARKENRIREEKPEKVEAEEGIKAEYEAFKKAKGPIEEPISEEIEVTIKETGKKVKMKRDVRKALKTINTKIENYNTLIECMGT